MRRALVERSFGRSFLRSFGRVSRAGACTLSTRSPGRCDGEVGRLKRRESGEARRKCQAVCMIWRWSSVNFFARSEGYFPPVCGLRALLAKAKMDQQMQDPAVGVPGEMVLYANEQLDLGELITECGH